MNDNPPEINSLRDIKEITFSDKIWLFLDYDGTLASFAPTPDHILPDPELIQMLQELEQQSRLRVSVVSGRRLAHIQKLLPVKNILLAGSYGLEMQLPNGEPEHRLSFEKIRPHLDAIKPHWQALLEGRENFYLEDKGWSLAIHARYADETEGEEVLERALPLAKKQTDLQKFRVLGGYKFIEIGPRLASKGETIQYLLERFPWPDAKLIYIGDDDKDEEAFTVVQEHGGLAIVVAIQPRPTHADYRLAAPQEVRSFLRDLLSMYSIQN